MVWVEEISYGLLKVFLQPLLYITIGLAIWTSYRRVKADRVMFGHRVFPRHAEWSGTWLWSLLFFVLFSSALIFTGVTVTYEWMLAVSIIILLISIFNQVALLSPAYTIGVTTIGLYVLKQFDLSHPFLDKIYSVDMLIVSYLLIGLLLVEAILFLTTKRNRTFPQLHKGNRGKYIGSHIAKRLMIVPMLMPVPSGVLTLSPYFDWWPVFSLGGSGFSLILFPFLIGISQRFQGSFSEVGAKRTGKWLLGLVVLLIAGAVGANFIPGLTIAIFIVALFGRLGILLFTRFSDLEKRPIFTPRSDGMIVVGVIPKSPADQMGVLVGEVIEKIHDVPVANEHEFFEVMSEKRTYCKLTLRNLNGEIRFAQRSLYEGDLHELGLIFVKETPRFTLKTEIIDRAD
ncbi:hypothetical protein ACLIA0_06550 [Bacillaceae bacterium W0354]